MCVCGHPPQVHYKAHILPTEGAAAEGRGVSMGGTSRWWRKEAKSEGNWWMDGKMAVKGPLEQAGEKEQRDKL